MTRERLEKIKEKARNLGISRSGLFGKEVFELIHHAEATVPPAPRNPDPEVTHAEALEMIRQHEDGELVIVVCSAGNYLATAPHRGENATECFQNVARIVYPKKAAN